MSRGQRVRDASFKGTGIVAVVVIIIIIIIIIIVDGGDDLDGIHWTSPLGGGGHRRTTATARQRNSPALCETAEARVGFLVLVVFVSSSSSLEPRP